MAALHISIKAEEIAQIVPGITVTNSLLATWIVMGVLTGVSYAATHDIRLIPGKLQLTFEIIVEALQDLFVGAMGPRALKFFPLLATLFLFILLMNWSGLIPGFGTIEVIKYVEGVKESVPLLRAGTADLNLTLALSLIAFFTIQAAGLKELGFGYVKKFINVSNPINMVVGILEIISELSKIISFSFRLFGNIFAGEVLLTVMGFLVPVFVPIPFYGIELFVGAIQAVVFPMLTSVFISNATMHEEH